MVPSAVLPLILHVTAHMVASMVKDPQPKSTKSTTNQLTDDVHQVYGDPVYDTQAAGSIAYIELAKEVILNQNKNHE